MTENRLPDYLDHMQQAAMDACTFVEGYPEFARTHTAVPWRSMRGMSNRIAHGYFDINLDVVWDTVQLALPELLRQLVAVRP